jgi:hypothetical protein
LDERFYPVYYVDHDIGMAVRQLGMVVLYQPKSRIRHHQGASSNPRFRGFAARRNQQLFLQKWAAALQEHEPKEGSLPAAIERAMARAEARAERCRREGPAALDRSVERRSFDPNQQQLQSWQRSRDFQKAYITHLGEELDAAEVERDRWQNALATGTENSSPSAAGPAYPFGTTLRFGKNGTAYRHAFTGCYSPEEWGAWMGNDPFRVLLPLADRADGTNSATQQLTMTLEAQHFLVKGRRLSPMRLLVNGTQLLEIDENRAGPQHYSVPVSPAVHGSSAHLMIEIKPANALPPDALGLSFDDRPLSIGLISLAIYRTSGARIEVRLERSR